MNKIFPQTFPTHKTKKNRYKIKEQKAKERKSFKMKIKLLPSITIKMSQPARE
jgi:hypothetical protein